MGVVRRSRGFALVPVLISIAFVAAACVPALEGSADVGATPAASASESKVSEPNLSADWDCGYASALVGLSERSLWEFEAGVIDDAEWSARESALLEAWQYAPVSGSAVTSWVRRVSNAAVAEGGVRESAFVSAQNDLIRACGEAGSTTIVNAVPGMGG